MLPYYRTMHFDYCCFGENKNDFHIHKMFSFLNVLKDPEIHISIRIFHRVEGSYLFLKENERERTKS